MGADFFFRMGASHAVCQDYALAGEVNGVQYATLSDGCSGLPISWQPGSPFTDFGARFMVLAAQRLLVSDRATRSGFERAVWSADKMNFGTSLPSTALDATLLLATADARNITVFRSGDGVIVYRGRDGSVLVDSVEFGGNAPFYQSYQMSEKRLSDYLKLSESITNDFWARALNKTWDKARITRQILASDIVYETQVSRKDFDLVLLFSDGVDSFQKSDGEPVPLDLVVDQLVDFKGYAGQFITRRCNRFLTKFCAENGWKHSDDFSCAGIYLGDTP